MNYDDKLHEIRDKEKREKAQKRIDEIEDKLLEMPFTEPNFEKLALERNNLLILLR